MKVFVVQAEHFNVPGTITHVHANLESAESQAIELVDLMISDSFDDTGVEVPQSWEDKIFLLQNIHGAAHCYVEIIETELRGTFQP